VLKAFFPHSTSWAGVSCGWEKYERCILLPISATGK